jgi:iron complex transport system ATP-binding protein
MIDVRDLSFSYNADRKILREIAFDAKKGECIAILGNNGAGKSTLIKCLNRILAPQCGTVIVDGGDVRKMNRQDIARRMAYVSQKNDGDRLTVFDAVLLGRKPYIKLNATDDDLAIVSNVIERMKLTDYQLRFLDELSGGEMQKVMLARALAQQPRVLMLDEPTSNLDLRNQYEVLSIVRDIAKNEGISVIIVIHDLNLAIRYCDRFIFLKDSQVYSYGGLETITAEAIEEVYRMHTHIIEYMDTLVIVPFPDEKMPDIAENCNQGNSC